MSTEILSTEILTNDRASGGFDTRIHIVPPHQQDTNLLAVRHPQFQPLKLKNCFVELGLLKKDHHDSYLFPSMPVVQNATKQPLPTPNTTRLSNYKENLVFTAADVMQPHERG